MTMFRSIYRFLTLLVCGLAAMMTASCELSEELDRMRDTIKSDLNRKNIFERGNLPPNQNMDLVEGYYDIIDGAYRWIENEPRPNRVSSPPIKAGDRISFYFDAKVFKGSSDNAPTFYTNMADRMAGAVGGNQGVIDGDTPIWPTDPLIITLGDDPGILKHVQTALIGCRADNNIDNDDIESDRVMVYLPYDIGFGNNWVNTVPPRSTLLFEISGIRLVE